MSAAKIVRLRTVHAVGGELVTEFRVGAQVERIEPVRHGPIDGYQIIEGPERVVFIPASNVVEARLDRALVEVPLSAPPNARR